MHDGWRRHTHGLPILIICHFSDAFGFWVSIKHLCVKKCKSRITTLMIKGVEHWKVTRHVVFPQWAITSLVCRSSDTLFPVCPHQVTPRDSERGRNQWNGRISETTGSCADRGWESPHSLSDTTDINFKSKIVQRGTTGSGEAASVELSICWNGWCCNRLGSQKSSAEGEYSKLWQELDREDGAKGERHAVRPVTGSSRLDQELYESRMFVVRHVTDATSFPDIQR